MNFSGILLGILSFLIIGIWHPIVVKGEYHFGKRVCTPVFLCLGVLCCILSVIVSSQLLSVALALLGFSSLWGIKEVREQEKRVERGWFPKNPKRDGRNTRTHN